MSIIYEGLNPKNHYGLCILTKDGELITADGKHYQAIQIPKGHGRLVDADDIKAKCINEVFESMGTVAITDPYFDDEWADDICDVPTILEAEE